MRTGAGAAIVLVIAACGGGSSGPADAGTADAGPRGQFEIVGHSDLGARGMNAALAVAGDTAYVGSRIDSAGTLIVDISDPAAPQVVGAIDQGVQGLSSRELRAVGDLLVVLNLECSPDLHGCIEPRAEVQSLKLYDISNRRAPQLVGTYPFPASFQQRAPHEMYLWQDPAEPARVLIHVATPLAAPQYEIVDVSDPTAPVQVATWDPIADGGLVATRSGDSLLHSVSLSDDGRTGYFSHLQGGLFLADLGDVVDGATPPAITMLTASGMQADWAPPEPAGPHSAVPVPGRDLLVVTDEVYPVPFGTGCPYGWMRTVDVSDPAAPVVAGEFRVPENTGGCASAPATTTFTAHNATVTENLALVSWHSAGLQAIDISDPAQPTPLAELRPAPLDTVAVEDPGLGGHPLLMWSYPVIQDGLIHVVDIRNGLYILRYRGELADEVEAESFEEGNSNL